MYFTPKQTKAFLKEFLFIILQVSVTQTGNTYQSVNNLVTSDVQQLKQACLLMFFFTEKGGGLAISYTPGNTTGKTICKTSSADTNITRFLLDTKPCINSLWFPINKVSHVKYLSKWEGSTIIWQLLMKVDHLTSIVFLYKHLFIKRSSRRSWLKFDASIEHWSDPGTFHPFHLRCLHLRYFTRRRRKHLFINQSS